MADGKIVDAVRIVISRLRNAHVVDLDDILEISMSIETGHALLLRAQSYFGGRLRKR